MPTYEYECEACGSTFERFQGITEEPIRRCPRCRRAKVRRLIGAGGGFLFRGSGFYATDYRSSEYQAKAKAEAGTPATSGKAETPAKDAPKKGAAHAHEAKAGT